MRGAGLDQRAPLRADAARAWARLVRKLVAPLEGPHYLRRPRSPRDAIERGRFTAAVRGDS